MCFTISASTTYEGYAQALISLKCVIFKFCNAIKNQPYKLIIESHSVAIKNVARKGHDTMYQPKHGSV